MSEPRVLLDAKADLGEGPLWSARDQAIYWTDIKVKKLNRYRLADGTTQSWDMRDTIGWAVERPQGTMFVWAPIPAAAGERGSLAFATMLAREAKVAVSPGEGFGPGGEGHVRFALVENEQRIRQAVRGIGRVLAR